MDFFKGSCAVAYLEYLMGGHKYTYADSVNVSLTTLLIIKQIVKGVKFILNNS